MQRHRCLVVVLLLPAAAGCGRVDSPATDDAAFDGGAPSPDAGEVDASHDTSSVDVGAEPDGSVDGASGCPATPPSAGPSDCTLGLECTYYDACFKGGTSAFKYTCVWPFDQPKQWRGSVIDCSGAIGPDGCPLTEPLIYTLCTKPGVSCKYKTCTRSICSSEDGGIHVWKPNLDDCSTDGGPG